MTESSLGDMSDPGLVLDLQRCHGYACINMSTDCICLDITCGTAAYLFFRCSMGEEIDISNNSVIIIFLVYVFFYHQLS